MRPRRLTLRGLRSYRAECTIDFGDRGLVAIVGDTGAGKSSILEAITYALYNATTWDQRAVGQLIADGVQSMSVELEFQAGDSVWSVHRACHRAAGRPSTHRLRCLSDTSMSDFDGEAQVNRQIERLVGMSYQAYKTAVVLPQGRFQTLLQETPAKRTAILEGIFRLTDLRDVQKAARAQGERAAAAVRDLTTRREMLLPDPAATRAALESEADVSRQREALLLELRAEASRLRDVTRKAGERAESLREHARRTGAADDGAARRLADLLPLAAALTGELEETSAAAEQVEQAAAVAAAAAAAGESVEALARAAELLKSVRQALTELEAAEQSAEREAADLDAISTALADGESALPALEAEAQVRDDAAHAAADSLEEQRELGRRVREALRTAREAAALRDSAADEERRHREALPRQEEQLAERRRQVSEAESALDSRRAALEDGQRGDAAAHAADGLEPGDRCPVCGEVLGEGFQPPSAGDLRPLKQAAREAETELAACRTAETTAAHQLAEGRRRLAEAVERRETSESTAQGRLQDLHLIAPHADLDLDDDLVLRPFDERTRELQAAAAAEALAADEALERVLTARADLSARRTDLDGRVRRLERDRKQIDEKRAWCAAQLGTLPVALAVRAAGCPGDLDEAIADAARRLEEARKAREELDALRAEATRLAGVRSQLQARLADEIARPRSAAMRSAAELRLRIDDCLRWLGQPATEAAPGDADLDVEVRWAAELERRAAALRQQLEEAVVEAEQVGADADAEITRRLAACGLPDVNALDAELREVRLDLGRIQSEIARAETQLPQAVDLDGWVATGTEVRDSLSELVRLLQDAQFVGHVIERRQRQLLIVASRILGSMTGDAYGFAADFEIVDRSTNQPRPARTLSGGETFLASLALALALVEIAGRSGTRLDALFLDEGFGSLDANALDDALSALELQASGGRLVAVVSHVRAVAERIETVLEVTRTTAGSRAEWRGGAERELMLTAELEDRLLA